MTKVETIEIEELKVAGSNFNTAISDTADQAICSQVAEMVAKVKEVNSFRCDLGAGFDLIVDLIEVEDIDWQKVYRAVQKINQDFNDYLDAFSSKLTLSLEAGNILYKVSKLAHDAKNLISMMFCYIDNILEGGGGLDKRSFVRSLNSLREMAEGYLGDSVESNTFEVLDFWDYLRPWLGHLQMRFSGRILIDVDSGVLKMNSQNCFAVTRVIDNLIGNSVDAIEGMGGDFKKTIHLKIHNKEGVMVLIVADNGPGIPKDLVKNFWRMGVSSKKGNGGSGMGMGIVIDNVEAFGGNIQYKSFREEDRRGFTGTIFKVTIPMENLVG